MQLITRLSNYGVKEKECKGIKFVIEKPKFKNETTEHLTPGQVKKLVTAIHEDTNPIARMMELVNALYLVGDAENATPEGKLVLSEVFGRLLPMLSPFIPHVAAELWESLGNRTSLHDLAWPGYSEALAKRDEIEIVFQVNGKIRGKEMVAAGITKDEMEKMARGHEKVKADLEGKSVKKVIVVPGKLVNIVVQ